MIVKPPKITWALWSSLFGVFLMSAVPAQSAQNESGKIRPVVGSSARTLEPKEKAGETKREITYTDGKLSVNLKNAELDGVLKEIGKAVKARVEIGTGISAMTSATFSNLSLEDGLAALIKGEGVGIVLCYEKNGAVTLMKLSKKVGLEPEQVYKVKKVRNYFSPQDEASGLSMRKIKNLMDTLRDSKQKREWIRAAKRIMYIRNPEAKPLLKELFTHEDDFVRDEAVREYAMLVDAEDADFILDLAEDKTWQRRNAAAEIAMPLVDDPRQTPILIKMLHDYNPAIQASAIGAVGIKKLPAAVPVLEEMLKTGEAGTRAMIAETLYYMTDNKYEWMNPAEKAVFDKETDEFNARVKKRAEEYEKKRHRQ